jgi:uncharacterized phage-associated protein
MYDARDVANFILDSADRRDLRITNLALQKLLYFAHGGFFAMFEEPLIRNKFEAWQFGPVQRMLYDQFKFFKEKPIIGTRATHINPDTGEPFYRAPDIDPDHAAIIEQVLDQYSGFSAGQLVEESHAEDGPWEYVWQQADDVVFPGMRIPDSMILEHFKRLVPRLTVH